MQKCVAFITITKVFLKQTFHTRLAVFLVLFDVKIFIIIFFFTYEDLKKNVKKNILSKIA